MDHAAIRAQLPSLVSGHIPRNVRRFKYTIHDDRPMCSAMGFHVDPKPFEGRVVARNDEAVIVQTGRAEFAVLDRSLTTEAPEPGVKVLVTPYARRRFDGERADTPEVRTEYLDGTAYRVKTMTLGSASIKLPLPEPRCGKLRDLIRQLEELPAADGFRHITHMMVDAGAKDFTWVDPLPADIVRTPPAIGFAVATAKFAGRVNIHVDAAADHYVIETKRGDETVERIEPVYFNMIGQTLERLIDDGRWRMIRVEILAGGRRPTRH